MDKSFKRAAWAGVAFILCAVPTLGMAVSRHGREQPSTAWMVTWVALCLVGLVCYVVFMLGFRDLGDRTGNLPLELMACVLIAFSFLDFGYSISEFWLPRWAANFFGLALLFLAGALGVAYGLSLFRLKATVGKLGTAAGVLEIVIGASFMTMLMFLVGIVLYLPSLIVQTRILFRAAALWGEPEIEDEPPPCPAL
jgi:hypothetical protein